MTRAVHFATDVAHLPTHKFGTSSLTWWGIVGFMVIEGVAFGVVFAAYFYLMGQGHGWPPHGTKAPTLVAGTAFTILILLSEIPNTRIKKAARLEDVATVRRLLPLMIVVGLVLFVIRGFEFDSLNVKWTDNAYGSVIWALLLLHTTHILTDWYDTVILAALVRTPFGNEDRRFEDVDENSMYWRYVWLLWIPIYLMIYWVPRL
jgi:heme/copper-type cytochrome/quinol oxidase subunit 3